MRNYDESVPVRILKSWFEHNQELFCLKCNEIKFTDTGHGSAYVDLDTDFYISRITAWDHAICLNMEIINIETEETTVMAEGACLSIAEFEVKLSKYLKWLEE